MDYNKELAKIEEEIYTISCISIILSSIQLSSPSTVLNEESIGSTTRITARTLKLALEKTLYSNNYYAMIIPSF